jgi:Ca2+-binding RTX toxin-like protein
MTGGSGNDVFYVDNPGDEVIEAVGGGSDAIYSSIDYTLALGDEIESLRATAAATGLTLGGNELSNTLAGAAGDDWLSGGEGEDKLYGRDGDDTLDGGNGNDWLNGGAGADRMTGGSGNDVFYVDNPGDEVIEAVGGGSDTIYSSINYTLALGDEIESLRATAAAAGLTLGGNELGNTIVGAAGDDWLSGGEGEDKLYGRDGDDMLAGGAGNDRLEGGAGADIFLFDTPFMSVTNVDTVADFEIGIDTIRLDSTFFTGLALGHLSASAFAIDTPTGTDPQIVYNSANGSLFFDRDGTGPEGTASFAKVAGAPPLTAGSFFVV